MWDGQDQSKHAENVFESQSINLLNDSELLDEVERVCSRFEESNDSPTNRRLISFLQPFLVANIHKIGKKFFKYFTNQESNGRIRKCKYDNMTHDIMDLVRAAGPTFEEPFLQKVSDEKIELPKSVYVYKPKGYQCVSKN